MKRNVILPLLAVLTLGACAGTDGDSSMGSSLGQSSSTSQSVSSSFESSLEESSSKDSSLEESSVEESASSEESSSSQEEETSSQIDETPENIDKVVIYVWATAEEQQVIDAVIEDFNSKQTKESKKFKINFMVVPERDVGTTLAKDPTVDFAPALFLCADDHIPNLQYLNIVSEIEGNVKDKIIAENTKVAVEGATIDGKLYGYPVTSDNGYFLWYNKGFEGLESKIGSLEELLKFAKDNGKQVLMDVDNGWYASSFIMSPQANGPESILWKRNDEGKVYCETNWDNEKGVEVSEYIAGLLTEYTNSGTLVDGLNDQIIDGFESGDMIAAVSGTWMERELSPILGDDLAADKLPTYTIDGTAYQMASFTGSKIYAINKTRPVEEQKTAAALAELLTSKEAQLIRFEKRQSIPCNNEAVKDPRYTEHSPIGGAALLKQNEFACVQAKVAESRFWSISCTIGRAYIDSQLKDANGNTFTSWAAFLQAQMDTLRTAV